MSSEWLDTVESRLKRRKEELNARLERVTRNYRRPLDSDSKERATQMENHEVVDALGNEAQQELAAINGALHRLSIGSFGVCAECGGQIGKQRLMAQPYARLCIECANADERQSARH